MASGLMIWKGLGLLTNAESPIVVVLRYLLCTNLPPRIEKTSRSLSVDRWNPHSTAETCSSLQTPLNNGTTSAISRCTRSLERIYQSCIESWRLVISYPRNQSKLAALLLPRKRFTHFLRTRGSREAAVPNPESQLVLTKGDNNPVDDIALYRGLKYLERKHVVGKVRGYVSVLDVPAVISSVLYIPKCLGSCLMWDMLPSQWRVSILLNFSVVALNRRHVERFPPAQICLDRRPGALGARAERVIPTIVEFCANIITFLSELRPCFCF